MEQKVRKVYGIVAVGLKLSKNIAYSRIGDLLHHQDNF